MINKSIESITKSDIESLILNQVAESRTLEYKEKLPGNSDEDKREFLKDVSAFANTSGGDILYGVSEQRDSNGKTTGLPDQAKGLSGINADEQKRRLDSILQDGLDPRIPGIRIEAIDGFTDGFIIIIRVPKSWNSPHMVVFKNSSRFFARNSAGAYQLDVAEIRSTFIASESLAERIRQFRTDRIAKLLADEGPTLLPPGPKILLHLIPISTFSSLNQINISEVGRRASPIPPGNVSGWDARFNLDGILNYAATNRETNEAYSYAQLFRNGSIEAVCSLARNDNEKFISGYYETIVFQALKRYISLLQELEINPPVIVCLSLAGVRGYSVGDPIYASLRPYAQNNFDRDVLIIPEISIEDYSVALPQVLQQPFDTIWQASGRAGSPNYDDAGNWAEPR